MKQIILTAIVLATCLLSLNLVSSAGYVPVNVTTYVMHNESDATYSAYKQMKNISIDLSRIDSEAQILNNNVPVCWDAEWLAASQSYSYIINGTWNFNMYVNCTSTFNPGQYELFSRIIKINSSGEFEIANTSRAISNCSAAATPLLRNWTYSLASTSNFNSNERIGAQICAEVTGGGANNKYGHLHWEGTSNSRISIPISLYDNIGPNNITIYSPINKTYNSTQILINFTASDALTSVSSLWFNNESANTTYASLNAVYNNLTYGSHTFIFYANDSFNNINSTSLTFVINGPPNIINLTANPNSIKGGSLITIGSSVSDPNNDSLYFYCSESSQTPDAGNTICTGGNTFASYPYNLNCSYATTQGTANHTIYCRTYDNWVYSNVSNVTYSTSNTAPLTSLVSIAGRTISPYYDNVNDAHTDIIVSGNTNITCKWSISNIDYSLMSNTCSAMPSTLQANCSINDAGVVTEGYKTRYISCADTLGNGQNSSQNLVVQFSVDFTAPTTYDTSSSAVQAPTYGVTIIKADNVDPDPTTYYCTSPTQGCIPGTTISNGSQVSYTSSNRGINYLRYYSIDFAGNTQSVVNKTININQLSIFTSAIGNGGTFKGGTLINVSTISSDSDSEQTLTLFVCNSSSATAIGCGSGQYCTSTGNNNLSCTFNAENDSKTHTWYAFIFDSVNEGAVTSPLTGFYITDTSAPVISIVNPQNITYNQNTLTSDIIVNKQLTNAWYSINGGTNVSMANTTTYEWVNLNSSIAYGSYNIIFFANDSYGNIGISSIIYFTLAQPDTTPPVITIVTPQSGGYIAANNALINISTDENLSWAAYQLNKGTINALTQKTPDNWYKSTTLTEETTYNLTVYANDTSKNQANKTITFYADSLAPRYSSAQAVPSTANITQSVNCSISWTDGFSISSARIEENSTGSWQNHTIAFSGASGGASYVVPGALLTNPGKYACRFYATDVAGNINSTSVSFSVNDITPPTIIITGPSNITYAQTSISISIVTSKNATWAAYSLDGAANVNMGNTSLINWNATISSLSDQASHRIIFYANDSYGNMGNSSVLYFGVDTTTTDIVPPVITISFPSNASFYTSTSLFLNMSSNKNIGWAGYILNGGILTNMANSSLTAWGASIAGLTSGESTNTIQVYVNDTTSNKNKGNSNVTFYIDTIAPKFIDEIAIPDTVNESQSVMCSAYVNDTFGLSSVIISENSPGTIENHTIALRTAGYANYTISNLKKGTYECDFYAVDLAGNVNSTSTAFTVNDITPPTITINSPQNITYSASSILLSITTNENAATAVYSLDGGATNTSMDGSGVSWSKTIVLANGAHTVTFYAQDASGNVGYNEITFEVDLTLNDFVHPFIVVWSPANSSYLTSSDVLLNITTDKDLSWAGYSLNGGALGNLDNDSLTNWYSTLTLDEGQDAIDIYANDTSANKNQAQKRVTVYVDLTNPTISSFSCTNPVNKTSNVKCSASVGDNIGLNYIIFGYNATGEWQNSSEINLNGSSSTINYNISAGNTTPGSFDAEVYVYDLSGRSNMSSYTVDVLDNIKPILENISYAPNTTAELDPGVEVNFNASAADNYNLHSVELMYMMNSSSSWTSVNMSNIEGTNIYNASIIFDNGTWQFKINATDEAGNSNISSITILDVENDTTYDNSTDIPNVKSFTLSQASENNLLGSLFINNTGDNPLNFSVGITSGIASRININGSGSQAIIYNTTSGESIDIIFEVNTTDLPAGLYDYNITINSTAGTTNYPRQLNIQNAAGPYLFISIDNYASVVTSGQSGVVFSATVKNLGTSDATGIHINWNLPSIFTVVSGSPSIYISYLPVGVGATNTVTINVSSSAENQTVNVNASTKADGLNETSVLRSVVVLSPIIQTIVETKQQLVPTGTGGGGGGGGGGAVVSKAIKNAKEIEMVRGQSNSFEIEVENTNGNSSLNDLILSVVGYLGQYTEISPVIIKYIAPGGKDKFTVKLNIPSYQGYQEYLLNASVSGIIVLNGGIKQSYSEKYYFRIFAEEISHDDANTSLQKAEKAIDDMNKAGFYTNNVIAILNDSMVKLDERRNKEAYDLANEIVATRDSAFTANDLIINIGLALKDPTKISLLTGAAIREFTDFNGNTVSVNDIMTGRIFFSSSSAQQMLDLAVAAFQRGDYSTAEQRAKAAEVMLVLESKSNFGLFIYLYWQIILISIIALTFIIVLGYRQYQKISVGRRINSLEAEEENIDKLMVQLQKNYFAGRLSSGDYHQLNEQHRAEIAKIKKERTELRNRRIKLLRPEQISMDLDREKNYVENEIKKLQNAFYNEKKITEKDYNLLFAAYNERLAEIEDERVTVNMMENSRRNKSKKEAKVEIEESGEDAGEVKNEKIGEGKNDLPNEHSVNKHGKRILGWLQEKATDMHMKLKSKDKKGVVLIDHKTIEKVKKAAQGKDLRGKWIDIKEGDEDEI